MNTNPLIPRDGKRLGMLLEDGQGTDIWVVSTSGSYPPLLATEGGHGFWPEEHIHCPPNPCDVLLLYGLFGCVTAGANAIGNSDPSIGIARKSKTGQLLS